jgi:hypothetical protein
MKILSHVVAALIALGVFVALLLSVGTGRLFIQAEPWWVDYVLFAISGMFLGFIFLSINEHITWANVVWLRRIRARFTLPLRRDVTGTWLAIRGWSFRIRRSR